MKIGGGWLVVVPVLVVGFVIGLATAVHGQPRADVPGPAAVASTAVGVTGESKLDDVRHLDAERLLEIAKSAECRVAVENYREIYEEYKGVEILKKAYYFGNPVGNAASEVCDACGGVWPGFDEGEGRRLCKGRAIEEAAIGKPIIGVTPDVGEVIEGSVAARCDKAFEKFESLRDRLISCRSAAANMNRKYEYNAVYRDFRRFEREDLFKPVKDHMSIHDLINSYIKKAAEGREKFKRLFEENFTACDPKRLGGDAISDLWHMYVELNDKAQSQANTVCYLCDGVSPNPKHLNCK